MTKDPASAPDEGRSFADIICDPDGDVAEIILDRDGRLNALTPDMLRDIGRALDLCLAAGARALLIRANGKAFCAGADLRDDDAMPEDLGTLLEQHYNPLIRKLTAFPVPVVIAVQGAAAGAGCALALAGDFVVASRSACFMLAFVKVGLVPDAGSTWLIGRALGRARALEMMMLGEKLPASRALEWGLIHDVVDEEALVARARELARRLAAGPTQALGMIKETALLAFAEPLDTVLAREAANQRVAGRTPDHAEGKAAFRERRMPGFTGSAK